MDIVIQLSNVESKTSLLSSFLNSDVLPQLMQGVGTAIITIQVAFIIAVISGVLSDKPNIDNNKNYQALKMRALLDDCWKFKNTIIFIITLFLIPSLLLLKIEQLSIVVIFIWSILIYFLIRSLIRIYNWVKGDEKTQINQYVLKQDVLSEDLRFVWKGFWSQTHINIEDEESYFIKFSEKINLLIEKRKYFEIKNLLEDFEDFVSKRNYYFIVYSDTFLFNVLEWFFWFKNQNNLIHPEKRYIFYIVNIIKKIINLITQESLSKNGEYNYFNNLKKHFEKHKDDSIQYEKNIALYLESLSMLCFQIFEASYQSDAFPVEWKINKVNFQENLITRMWWINFIRWIESKNTHIISDKRRLYIQMSKNLDILFLKSEIDSITFFKVLNFVLVNHGNIANTIENNFNDISFNGVIFSDINSDQLNGQNYYDQIHENTLNLICSLFNGWITNINIDKWLSELDSLTVEDNKRFEKTFWIKLLKELKSYDNTN